MNRKNKIRIVGLTMLVLGVLGFVNMYHDIKLARKTDEVKYSKHISDEYNGLLKEYDIDSLNVEQHQESKTRNPFSLYSKNKDYYLMIYKFSTSTDKSLDKLIKINKSSDFKSEGVVYHALSSGIINLLYKSGIEDKFENIYLGYNGDILSIVKSNDSILHILFHTKNISIKYNKDYPVDMYLDNTAKLENHTKYPIDVVFLKKEQNIYLLLFYPFDVNDLTPVLLPNSI